MAYYAETNLIAIIVAAVLLFVNRKSSAKSETSQIIMNLMLALLIMLSASDAAAYFFRGKSYLGVELSNVVYLETMALGAFAWFLFIVVKLGRTGNIRATLFKTGIPMAILCVAIALNPLTSFFFTIDDQLLYHRGPGVIFTWLVEWGYLFAALGINVKAVVSEKSHYRKREYRGYLLFAMPMAIAAIAQMMAYGITTLQIGFMVALLLVFLNRQHYQVHRDDLTGLNNKNAFLSFQDSVVHGQSDNALTLFMADMDSFKQINDVHGHLTGDIALNDAAESLKAAAEAITHNRLLLFRYGGDEFVVVGRNLSDADAHRFEQAVTGNIEMKNKENQRRGKAYNLSMSIGHATGSCPTIEAFDHLVKQADQAMYAIKQAKKSSGDA